ncbi:MAG: hypothetical protein JWP64_1345 [Pseudonocardia sp.]|nr:hypothetical protein [Pseudonocardia sp.]
MPELWRGLHHRLCRPLLALRGRVPAGPTDRHSRRRSGRQRVATILTPAAPRPQNLAFARPLHSGRRNFVPSLQRGASRHGHGGTPPVSGRAPTMTNPNESDAKSSKGVRSASGPRSEGAPAVRRLPRGTATGAADAATSRVKGAARKPNRAATGRTPPDPRGRAAPKASKPRAAAVTNLAGKGAGAVQGTTGAVNSTVEGTVGTAVSTLRTGVGAGFSLAVHKALLLLQLLKRIALQTIEALRRRAIEALRRQAIEALRRLARRLQEEAGSRLAAAP